MNPVYIVGAKRSPIAKVKRGDPNTSSISSLTPRDLSVQVLNSLFEEVGLPSVKTFSFRLGSAISKTLEQETMFHAPAKYFISRTKWERHSNCNDASLIGGACATGLLAVWSGIKDISLGDSDLVVAGGIDMMSRHPDHMVSKIFLDTDTNKTMAELSDAKAMQLGYQREDQDNYAFLSYKRANEHLRDHELVKIVSPEGHCLEFDEGPVKMPSIETISRLGLLPNCRITSSAAASKYGDAAAFVALTSEHVVSLGGLSPIGKIIGFGRHSESDAESFIKAPVHAISKALIMAGIKTEDVDLFEINEAV